MAIVEQKVKLLVVFEVCIVYFIGNNRSAVAEGDIYLALDPRRHCRLTRKDQHNDPASLDSLDDDRAILLAERNIAWGNKAPDTFLLQRVADSIGRSLIFTRVTYKYIV